jgi:arrestin-2
MLSRTVLNVLQLQCSPAARELRLPTSRATKGFTFSDGKLNLEVTLDKETYYHGESLAAHVVVSNHSRKSVRSIKV